MHRYPVGCNVSWTGFYWIYSRSFFIFYVLLGYITTPFPPVVLSSPGVCLQLESGVPLPSPQELMGKILIKNKKSHKPPNNTDAKRPADQPANQSSEPAFPSNNAGGEPPRQRGPLLLSARGAHVRCFRADRRVLRAAGAGVFSFESLELNPHVCPR